MRTLKTASVIAALVLVAAAPADGRTRKIESFIRHVDVSTDEDVVERIEGTVQAKTDKCIGDRRVAVFADPHGDEPKSFGEATTDDDGDFDVTGTGPTDIDYAIAVFRERRDGIRCLGKGIVIHVDAS